MKKIEEMIKKEFKDHVATFSEFVDENGFKIQRLKWKNPESSNYYINYLIFGGVLFVCGDCGNAVYQWYEQTSFKWISNYNLDYFASKCKDSNTEEWDSDLAKENLLELINEEIKESKETEDFYKTEVEKKRESILEKIKESLEKNTRYIDYFEDYIDNILFSQESWSRNLENCGSFLFGDDFWEYTFNIGIKISTRTRQHLIGIKMAVEQKEKEK